MVGDPQNTSKRYAGRALPVLLSEGWTISDTVAAGDGAYVILTGRDVPMPEDIPDAPPEQTSGGGVRNFTPSSMGI